MTDSGLPIAQIYELGRLSQAGDEVLISPPPDDLSRIARWAGIDALEGLTAAIALKKYSPTRFALEIALDADIVQSCVVTLDAVRTHIERRFERELILTPAGAHSAKEVDVEVAPVDDDGREEISSLRYDLAGPVLEELALAIDPYPRVPGVAFESPQPGPDSPERPFAALKGLKFGSKP